MDRVFHSSKTAGGKLSGSTAADNIDFRELDETQDAFVDQHKQNQQTLSKLLAEAVDEHRIATEESRRATVKLRELKVELAKTAEARDACKERIRRAQNAIRMAGAQTKQQEKTIEEESKKLEPLEKKFMLLTNEITEASIKKRQKESVMQTLENEKNVAMETCAAYEQTDHSTAWGVGGATLGGAVPAAATLGGPVIAGGVLTGAAVGKGAPWMWRKWKLANTKKVCDRLQNAVDSSRAEWDSAAQEHMLLMQQRSSDGVEIASHQARIAINKENRARSLEEHEAQQAVEQQSEAHLREQNQREQQLKEEMEHLSNALFVAEEKQKASLLAMQAVQVQLSAKENEFNQLQEDISQLQQDFLASEDARDLLQGQQDRLLCLEQRGAACVELVDSILRNLKDGKYTAVTNLAKNEKKTIAVAGCRGVGKSSLINRVCGKKVSAVGNVDTTNEFKKVAETVDTEFWDVPGQTDSRNIFDTSQLQVLRRAHLALIVYTDDISTTYKAARVCEALDTKFLLVRNKVDSMPEAHDDAECTEDEVICRECVKEQDRQTFCENSGCESEVNLHFVAADPKSVGCTVPVGITELRSSIMELAQIQTDGEHMELSEAEQCVASIDVDWIAVLQPFLANTTLQNWQSVRLLLAKSKLVKKFDLQTLDDAVAEWQKIARRPENKDVDHIQEQLPTYMYTLQEPPLYSIISSLLNDVTKRKGPANREKVEAALTYCQWFLSATRLLPDCTCKAYRFVDYVYPTEVWAEKFEKGSVFCWYSVKSATTTPEEVQDTFTSGGGTVFIIENCTAKSIAKFSSFPKENEVILEPGAMFQVERSDRSTKPQQIVLKMLAVNVANFNPESPAHTSADVSDEISATS